MAPPLPPTSKELLSEFKLSKSLQEDKTSTGDFIYNRYRHM